MKLAKNTVIKNTGKTLLLSIMFLLFCFAVIKAEEDPDKLVGEPVVGEPAPAAPMGGTPFINVDKPVEQPAAIGGAPGAEPAITPQEPDKEASPQQESLPAELPPPPQSTPIATSGDKAAGTSSSPASAGGEKTATLIFQQAKVELALQALTSQTGVTVIPRGKVVGQRVDTLYRNMTAKEILEQLAYKYKWVSRKVEDNRYELMDDETYQKEVLPTMKIQKIFKLKNITATEAYNRLKDVSTKNIGATIAADDRTNKLIVTDLPQVIEMIKRLLDQIDVKLMTRIFYIKHANIDQIVDKLSNYKSEPGYIDFDPKTHQVIVIDTFENIKKMEMIIDVLDVGPEMKIYDINNIGFDGKLIDDLRALIEKVVTADAFWEINYRAGTLLVEDVPEVHEKIEKILLAFDRPAKQVYIQAEMIETTLSETLSLGSQYDISQNLKTAVSDGVYQSWKDSNGNEMFPIKSDYGYQDLYDEFPFYSVSGGGLSVKYLDRHIKALFTAAMSDVNTKILTQPRLIVKNQETATIHVGGKKPYVTYYYNSNNSSYGNSSTTQAEKDYGTKLELKPSISNNGLIELNIKIEQSVAKDVEGKTVGGTVTLIETTNEEAATTLIIPSGETRVIGGLIKSQETDSKTGVPFLAKIPVIGPVLFGKRSTTNDKINLYFFVTPSIVEETGTKRKKFSVRTVEEDFPELKEDETGTTETLPMEEVTTDSLKTKSKDIKSLLESSEDVPKNLDKLAIGEDKLYEDTGYKMPISGPSFVSQPSPKSSPSQATQIKPSQPAPTDSRTQPAIIPGTSRGTSGSSISTQSSKSSSSPISETKY